MTKRARDNEGREARRNAILDVARTCCLEKPPQELTMAEVASRARLAKGTLYLYFPTKEALLLALLEQMLVGWRASLATAIDEAPPQLQPEQLADLLVTALAGRPLLGRLLAVLDPMLSQNVPMPVLRRFKQSLYATMEELGRQIEQRVRGLRDGDGVRLLLYLHAAAVGLAQIASPPAAVRRIIREERMHVLEIDLRSEFHQLVVIIIDGMRRRQRS
jgi:AcrR family transcriptional regulator